MNFNENQHFIEINMNGIGTNIPKQFPWTKTLENKWITGVETFTRTLFLSTNLDFGNSGLPIVNSGLAGLLCLTFKDENNIEQITNMPYKALTKTGAININGQARQIKPAFKFKFSSKDSFVSINLPTIVFSGNEVVYICFKYLP